MSVDVLIQDELAHPSLFFLNRRLKRVLACPFISIVHHLRSCEARPAWQNRFYRLVEKAYLLSVDGFIVNSEDTRKAVTSLVGNGKPDVVAYPGGDRFAAGVTPEDVSARALAEGPLRILFVGNITPRKGLHTLLDALSLLPEGAWQLSVVGSEGAHGAYTRSVRHLLEKVSLHRHVNFLGRIPDASLAGLLAASHLLVVPSSYEGFGIVYLEAMGFGLPVLASGAGGAKELVRDGINGFLITPGDTAALAQHVRDLADDRQRLRTMSLAALRHFSSHPTWADAGEKIYTFLHSLRQ
jgi:glycosyltransferase involved in cell wall biosynthesis